MSCFRFALVRVSAIDFAPTELAIWNKKDFETDLDWLDFVAKRGNALYFAFALSLPRE